MWHYSRAMFEKRVSPKETIKRQNFSGHPGFLGHRNAFRYGNPSVPMSQGRWAGEEVGQHSEGWTLTPLQTAEATCSYSQLQQACLTTALLAPRRLIKLSVAHTLILPLTLRDTRTPARVNCANSITQIDTCIQRRVHPPSVDRKKKK